MARMKLKGFEEYERRLSQLGREALPMIEAAVDAGSNVGADAMRAAIQSYPTVEGRQKNPSALTQTQKQGLLDGFGVTPIAREGDFIHRKLGVDGYNAYRTKTYPKGQPNIMVLRIAESGSSVRAKTPRVRQAMRRAKKQIEQAMADTVDQETERIMIR